MIHCPTRNSNSNKPTPCSHCGSTTHTSANCPTLIPVKINGNTMKVRNKPKQMANFQPEKTWSKYRRTQLSTEDRIVFDNKAGGHVLGKNNKLKIQSKLDKDDDALKHIHNIQLQIRALEKHFATYDLGDTNIIVQPVDLLNSPTLKTETFNLTQDYPKLSPDVVAMSNAYYNMWSAEDYISSNLELTYEVMQKNTEERLFNKCLEDYDRYHPMQQGGPLMFSLVMSRIHNESEKHMEHLKKKVEALKISTVEGEDVDEAISLIESAYTLFQSCSTSSLSRIPAEWEKTLLNIFQTTSVSEFNNVFAKILSDHRTDADMKGIQPTFPSHFELVKLASRTYQRIKFSNRWDVPKSAKSKAYCAKTNNGDAPAALTTLRKIKCWNCDVEGHHANDCTKPRNEQLFEKNKKAYARNNNKSGKSKPKRRKIDGKPHILNKKGVYVLDQAKVQAQKKTKEATAKSNDDKIAAAIASLTAASTPGTSAPPTSATPPSSEPVMIRAPAHSVQDVLRGLLSSS